MSCERTEEEIRSELAAVKRMIGSGVLTMSYDGRSMTYRSMDEMKEARASLEAELGNISAEDAVRHRRFAVYVSGY